MNTYRGRFYFFSERLGYGVLKTKEGLQVFVKLSMVQDNDSDSVETTYYEVEAEAMGTGKTPLCFGFDGRLAATSIKKISKQEYDNPMFNKTTSFCKDCMFCTYDIYARRPLESDFLCTRVRKISVITGEETIEMKSCTEERGVKSTSTFYSDVKCGAPGFFYRKRSDLP